MLAPADRRNPKGPPPLESTEPDVLSGEEIVCFSHTPWRGPWKASQQIMSRLARSNRVVYVGPPPSLRRAVAALRAGDLGPPRFEPVISGLTIYHGPWWYATARQDRWGSRPFNRWIGRARVSEVRRHTRARGARPILWVFDPMMAGAVGTFGEKLVIYHVLDNYVEFFAPEAAALRSAMAEHEARMIARADLVFTVSERLHHRIRAAHPRVVLVPNGVDYEGFQAAVATAGVPPEMRSIRRPIIGYVGVIQSDLDLPLLERLARECPEASLVFIGPVEDLGRDGPDFAALLRRPNVHYLGSKPVQDVPAYVNGCDVCIMPTGVDKPTAADCDSLKLYEYLACGKPVVSTDLPSVQKVRSVIRVARCATEFIGHVKASVAEPPGAQADRLAVAREHSWPKRLALINQVVRGRLCEAATLRSAGSAPAGAAAGAGDGR